MTPSGCAWVSIECAIDFMHEELASSLDCFKQWLKHNTSVPTRTIPTYATSKMPFAELDSVSRHPDKLEVWWILTECCAPLAIRESFE